MSIELYRGALAVDVAEQALSELKRWQLFKRARLGLAISHDRALRGGVVHYELVYGRPWWAIRPVDHLAQRLGLDGRWRARGQTVDTFGKDLDRLASARGLSIEIVDAVVDCAEAAAWGIERRRLRGVSELGTEPSP